MSASSWRLMLAHTSEGPGQQSGKPWPGQGTFSKRLLAHISRPGKERRGERMPELIGFLEFVLVYVEWCHSHSE